MAIGLNTIYPSARFIDTDAKGDVQEVSAQDASDASASIQGIQIDAVASNVDGNGITFQITENNVGDSITATDNTVTLGLFKQASDYRLNEYSIDTLSTSAHTGIEIGEFIYFIADDTVSWKENATGTSTNVNVTAGTSLEVIGKDGTNRPVVVIDGTEYAVMAGNYKTTFGRRLDSITTILGTASTDVTDLVSITLTGSDSDNLTGTGSVVTEGGNLAVESELNPNSKYLLLDIADIYDLEESEILDGRKLFYGLLETATANIASSGATSDSLVINRGNLILVTDNKLRRSYNITATLDILDSDLSDES